MKRATSSPLDIISGIFDRLFGLLGALILSQFPQFYGQYMQRLGGHLKEAEITLQRYINAARSLGLSLQEYVDHHLVSEDRIYTSSGEVIGEVVERYQFLEDSFQVLSNASPFNRWILFIRQADWSIAQHTWQEFTPGVPTTLEGIIYALVGLFVGWGLYHAIRRLFLRLFYRKKVNFKF